MDETYRRYLVDGERAGMRYALAEPQRAATGVAGALLGRSAGASLEFMDHREYRPGDDLRRIDWGAYARTDKLIVKLYREEINPHLDIVIDGSRSMALPDTAKLSATLGLAAVFATAAENAGFSHCAWIAGQGCERVGNGTERPSVWDDLNFDYTGSPAESLSRLPPAWRPHGIRLLLSDLLWLADPLSILCHFVENARAVIVAQVLAQADVDPPVHANLRLVDSETHQAMEVFVNDSAEKRYRDTLS
ncbi:MAG: DUF58 domain-containing protein, partial [Planctomycetia bacterium]|nr:DUF58 domain-containing protein [Planctomycetia bacterium]